MAPASRPVTALAYFGASLSEPEIPAITSPVLPSLLISPALCGEPSHGDSTWLTCAELRSWSTSSRPAAVAAWSSTRPGARTTSVTSMSPWPYLSVRILTPRADGEPGSWNPAAPRCSSTPAPKAPAMTVSSRTVNSTRFGAAITRRVSSDSTRWMYPDRRTLIVVRNSGAEVLVATGHDRFCCEQTQSRPVRIVRTRRHACASQRHRGPGLRRRLGRRLTARRIGVGGADSRSDDDAAGGHRDRQHLVGPGQAGGRVVPSHRPGLPGALSAGHRRRASRSDHRIPQALRRAGRLPRPARRVRCPRRSPGGGGAGSAGAEAVGGAQRRRASRT